MHRRLHIHKLVWLLLLVAVGGCRREQTARQQLEARFRRAGLTALRVAYALPAEVPARSIRFDLAPLRQAELYVRAPDKQDRYLHVDAAGTITLDGKPAGRIDATCQLILSPTGMRFFADGVAVGPDLADWDVCWVTDAGTLPDTTNVLHPAVDLADSFMRHELESGECRIVSGNWELAQHGGGLPETEDDAGNYNVQRAVNPFTVRGTGNGWLAYGRDSWFDYHAEASFYFGIPRTGHVVDVRTLPTQTDMLVAQGALDGPQVAFGWRGAQQAFVMLTREGDGPWQERARRAGKRPPLTNWIRIGLTVSGGTEAEGFLDGVSVAKVPLQRLVRGPFHLVGGAGQVELDDVRAWSLPGPEPAWPALHATSKQFGDKNDKERSDPEEFDEWAKGEGTFMRSRGRTAEGARSARIITTLPLIGDFEYQTVIVDAEGRRVRQGLYEFGLYPAEQPIVRYKEPAPLQTLRAEYTEKGWTLPGQPDTIWAPGLHVPTLRIRRRDDVLEILRDGRWLKLCHGFEKPVHFGVVRLSPEGRYLSYPRPSHHVLRCRNLVNEFFETAPVDWRWVEGAFRMDARWACQNQWNFMACGSTGVPYMSSQRSFHGDQVHEAFMSLRPMMPWDAGDDTFEYDVDADRKNKFEILRENGSWYNRHDLNISFCSDGLNPLSGYSLVFGGDDNRETRLLRVGEVLASTTDTKFRFPLKKGHGAVHWLWWKFTFRRIGARILVSLNDEVMFDVTDPEPLPGGHIGFWTVRNGFTVSRVTSIADAVERAPRLMYVADDAPSDWTPLVRDSLQLQHQDGPAHTRATATVGSGNMALRYTPAETIDLGKTPILKLPVDPGEMALGLHMVIGGHACLVQLGAPLSGMKALLVPEAERGECFKIPVLDDDLVRKKHLLATAVPADGRIQLDLLECWTKLALPAEPILSSLTIGNSSNADYLLAGRGGNRSGGTYAVGTPQFIAGGNGEGE